MTGSKPYGSGSVFLLAGGRETKKHTYRDVLKNIYAISNKEEPRIAYVGAANEDDPRFSSFMGGLLVQGGPCTFELAPLAGRQGTARKARAVIDSADVVFVGGGDVDLGMKWLLERDMCGCLRSKHAAGVPIFGVSAGAIMLCRRWIRWRDPDDDASAELFDCLGFAAIECDCHGEEDDWKELKALLGILEEDSIGYGIRSGAAVRVDGDAGVKVVAGQVDEVRLSAKKAR